MACSESGKRGPKIAARADTKMKRMTVFAAEVTAERRTGLGGSTPTQSIEAAVEAPPAVVKNSPNKQFQRSPFPSGPDSCHYAYRRGFRKRLSMDSRHMPWS